MKIFHFLFFLFISLFVQGQQMSSIGIQIGFDVSSPINDFTRLISIPSFGKIENAPKFHVNYGISYSYRVHKNSILSTGINYNAYGHHSNYLNIPEFEDREVYSENRYLTVPILYRYEIPIKKFSFYAEAGLLANFYLNSKLRDSFTDTYKVERRQVVLESGVFKFGVQLGMGLQYDISSDVQIFINPNYRLYPYIDTGYAIYGYKNLGVYVGVRNELSFEREYQ